jgi:hypothetical protein
VTAIRPIELLSGCRTPCTQGRLTISQFVVTESHHDKLQGAIFMGSPSRKRLIQLTSRPSIFDVLNDRATRDLRIALVFGSSGQLASHQTIRTVWEKVLHTGTRSCRWTDAVKDSECGHRISPHKDIHQLRQLLAISLISPFQISPSPLDEARARLVIELSFDGQCSWPLRGEYDR